MKKYVVIATTLGFALFMWFGSQSGWFDSNNPDSFPKRPAEPGFDVHQGFDGRWQGRREDVTGNNLCSKTAITGVVENGFVQLTLAYNGTVLTGWIDSQGQLTLYANHSQWDYRFSGNAIGDRIGGRWYLTNGPCKGSWSIERE
ncbi:hypothetical protein [Vibrio rhodolitus]|uniref:hypothetical protein n=1 Tax=Vibrio rhodolitus TaxID=2231649 RepID=UPI000E0A5371|nr:hypothetical protein [Vibrio rhodolitus]